jgi:hypothetical protein
MIPVVPALLNAIHDATGHRFQLAAGHIESMLQGGACVTAHILTINGRASTARSRSATTSR